MISLIIGIMVSLVVTIVGTPLLIKLVHKLNYGQYIRQDGPKSHLVKRGTPTLGGVENEKTKIPIKQPFLFFYIER